MLSRLIMNAVVALTVLGCANGPKLVNRRSANTASNDGIAFIFTFHELENMPELASLLTAINPDAVLVELDPQDARQSEIRDSRKEMIFALRWAQQSGKRTSGFDCRRQTQPDNFNEEAKAKVARDMGLFDQQYTWRDGNIESVAHKLVSISVPFTDPGRMADRQACMLRNIRAYLPRFGSVLILTGAYHSDFFRREFPMASFPATPRR